MERAGLIRGRVEGRREEADRQFNVLVYLYGNSVTLAPAMLILFFISDLILIGFWESKEEFRRMVQR